jgi:hypothetical protein
VTRSGVTGHFAGVFGFLKGCSKVLGQRIVIAGIGPGHTQLHHECVWKQDTCVVVQTTGKSVGCHWAITRLRFARCSGCLQDDGAR